ncbi:MAG TPA: NADH-quinone oxidoreductase subunit N, partial [Vicinamibacteria bacterium]
MTAQIDLRPVIPAIILALTGLVVLLAQAFTPRGRRAPSLPLSLVGLVAALASLWLIAQGSGRGAQMGGTVTADDFAIFFQALLVSIAIVAVLQSPSYLEAIDLERGEYYALVLFSLVGMLGLVSTRELVSMFVALEIMSIALYGLAGMRRSHVESQESALKYFVTGAFSSAFFLYGIALLYGVSGSTALDRIATALAQAPAGASAMAVLGAGMLLVGFGFKVASVPFHMWAPDVYEGAPTTVTALMAAGVKAAAFGAFLRVFLGTLPAAAVDWQKAVAVLAIVTMIVGNLAALAQTSLKRMLAYSSVAHAGYVLTALVAAPTVAGEAVLFYLVAYAAVNLGGFGVLAALARDGREPLSVSDLSGLSDRHPVLAAALT